jgi:hypothetical protein
MSPVGSLQVATSPAYPIRREPACTSCGGAPDGTSAASETARQSTTAEAKSSQVSNESKKADSDSGSYSTRTSFNAATGEWTLVVERHPPEVGVTVAEQKGFVSQYSARANSSASVRTAVSMRI